MNALATLESILSISPARIAFEDGIPWVPSPIPGKSSKPLRFLPDDLGFVELLRMEPGVAMPPHRHTGPTHAYNLRGTRELSSGEIVGPGDYVYEPAGNVDAWRVIGEEPLIALVVVMGEVEDLADDGSVRGCATTATRRAEYEAHCRETGVEPRDLTG
jgi:quercetin dioxygenase-like cupin family protein